MRNQTFTPALDSVSAETRKALESEMLFQRAMEDALWLRDHPPVRKSAAWHTAAVAWRYVWHMVAGLFALNTLPLYARALEGVELLPDLCKETGPLLALAWAALQVARTNPPSWLIWLAKYNDERS